MNVRWILVISMPTVPIPMEVLCAHVDLDMLEMDLHVMVHYLMLPSQKGLHYYFIPFHLAIPPPIALDGNGMVNVGRVFRLACRSVGDFSGPVVWMKDEETVPNIGVYLYNIITVPTLI